jgi:hypothetical protein
LEPLTHEELEKGLSGGGGCGREGGLRGEVRGVRVSFPSCLTNDVGQMGGREAWSWAQEREGGEGWGVESVEIDVAAFEADLSAEGKQQGQGQGAWSFTVKNCVVAHLEPQGVRQVYCRVNRFATRQQAQVRRQVQGGGGGKRVAIVIEPQWEHNRVASVIESSFALCLYLNPVLTLPSSPPPPSSTQVIDVLCSGVRLLWSPVQQLRVMKVCSDVTLSVWTTLLHLRRAALAHPSAISEEGKAGFEEKADAGQAGSEEKAENLREIRGNVNRPLDDVEALRSLEKRLHTFAGAKGDVRHR